MSHTTSFPPNAHHKQGGEHSKNILSSFSAKAPYKEWIICGKRSNPQDRASYRSAKKRNHTRFTYDCQLKKEITHESLMNINSKKKSHTLHIWILAHSHVTFFIQCHSFQCISSLTAWYLLIEYSLMIFIDWSHMNIDWSHIKYRVIRHIWMPGNSRCHIRMPGNSRCQWSYTLEYITLNEECHVWMTTWSLMIFTDSSHMNVGSFTRGDSYVTFFVQCHSFQCMSSLTAWYLLIEYSLMKFIAWIIVNDHILEYMTLTEECHVWMSGHSYVINQWISSMNITLSMMTYSKKWRWTKNVTCEWANIHMWSIKEHPKWIFNQWISRVNHHIYWNEWH